MYHSMRSKKRGVFILKEYTVNLADVRRISENYSDERLSNVIGLILSPILTAAGVAAVIDGANRVAVSPQGWAELLFGTIMAVVGLYCSVKSLSLVLDDRRVRRCAISDQARFVYATEKPLADLIDAIGKKDWDEISGNMGLQTPVGHVLNYELEHYMEQVYWTFPLSGRTRLNDDTLVLDTDAYATAVKRAAAKLKRIKREDWLFHVETWDRCDRLNKQMNADDPDRAAAQHAAWVRMRELAG